MDEQNITENTSTAEIAENRIQQQPQPNKKDKRSIVLLIIGAILCGIAIVGLIAFAIPSIQFIAHIGEQSGAAIGAAISFIYFAIPSMFLAAIACILTIISLCVSKKAKAAKIIFIILSALAIILNITFYLLLQLG